jgi:probable F420-dependent oxidoreductase
VDGDAEPEGAVVTSDLDPVGVAFSAGMDWSACLSAAPELEALGYGTIWISGGLLDDLGRVADVVRATKSARVGTAIVPVDRYGPDDVATMYAEIEAADPGRLIVGLGGAHGPKPLRTLNGYLDRLDAARPGPPAGSRVLAALGPRMLDLARDRTAGALPILVPPTYTAYARERLGPDALLIVQQCVALETDPARARAAGRGVIGFLSGVPGYVAHYSRLGFSDADIASQSDRMVDALTAWGDRDTISERVRQHLAAGASQVVLTVLDTSESGSMPLVQLRELAQLL